MAETVRGYILTRSVKIASLLIGGRNFPQFVVKGNPGKTRSVGTDGAISTSTGDTVYALVGIRANSSAPALEVAFRFASLIATTNDRFEWRLYQNPTIAGTFTYSDLPDSQVQAAIGGPLNIISDGIILPRGYGEGNATVQAQLESEFPLGESGAEIVLAVRPFTQNAAFEASLVWRELA